MLKFPCTWPCHPQPQCGLCGEFFFFTLLRAWGRVCVWCVFAQATCLVAGWRLLAEAVHVLITQSTEQLVKSCLSIAEQGGNPWLGQRWLLSGITLRLLTLFLPRTLCFCLAKIRLCFLTVLDDQPLRKPWYLKMVWIWYQNANYV